MRVRPPLRIRLRRALRRLRNKSQQALGLVEQARTRVQQLRSPVRGQYVDYRGGVTTLQDGLRYASSLEDLQELTTQAYNQYIRELRHEHDPQDPDTARQLDLAWSERAQLHRLIHDVKKPYKQAAWTLAAAAVIGAGAYAAYKNGALDTTPTDHSERISDAQHRLAQTNTQIQDLEQRIESTYALARENSEVRTGENLWRKAKHYLTQLSKPTSDQDVLRATNAVAQDSGLEPITRQNDTAQLYGTPVTDEHSPYHNHPHYLLPGDELDFTGLADEHSQPLREDLRGHQQTKSGLEQTIMDLYRDSPISGTVSYLAAVAGTYTRKAKQLILGPDEHAVEQWYKHAKGYDGLHAHNQRRVEDKARRLAQTHDYLQRLEDAPTRADYQVLGKRLGVQEQTIKRYVNELSARKRARPKAA